MTSGSRDVARSKPTLRSRLQAFVVIGVLALGIAAGLEILFRSGDLISTGLGVAGILTAHLVFFEVMVDGMIAATSRRRLGLNLASYIVFIAILIVVYAALFADIGLVAGGVTTHAFGDALFFAVVTWTTVGYGDLTAAAPLARFFAAVAALNGYVVMAILVAVLVSTFEKMFRPDRPAA